MTVFKLLCAVALVSVAATAPAAARHKHRHHHHHHHHHHAAPGAIFLHNYGPPVRPEELFATYDGPLSALCKQSAAAYRGQDGRRHPCY
jgi:G3E family GTPase